MQAAEFQRRSDAALARVARWLEAFDPDELDYATTDGVVTLEFADRTRYVLNRQAAADQMWYAAGARAWHFNWSGTDWVDDRDGEELMRRIAATVSNKLGRPVAAPGA